MTEYEFKERVKNQCESIKSLIADFSATFEGLENADMPEENKEMLVLWAVLQYKKCVEGFKGNKEFLKFFK
jgi:prefoldin subunit 5